MTADQLRPGDPYEPSDGRSAECLPSGRRGGRRNGTGFEVLDTDPLAEAAAADLGVSPRPEMLRAPDIAVGPIPDEPGWATEAKPLAIEYADTGQDEAELHSKIDEFLAAGTRWIWVVRLQGERRVEVYEVSTSTRQKAQVRRAPARAGTQKTRRQRARVALPGEALVAPGVLKNPVLVDALYDREAAHEATLRNLLQRRGYENIEAVREEGRNEGHTRGLRTAVRDLCRCPASPCHPRARQPSRSWPDRSSPPCASSSSANDAGPDHVSGRPRWMSVHGSGQSDVWPRTARRLATPALTRLLMDAGPCPE
ncbi:Uma2 family endonuclease [Sorangium cellulosum]|uniref:Uma2 family endonuclease n=1 Tax=Sorangium cellulosum TaxID=56 RepID=UPI003D9A66DF